MRAYLAAVSAIALCFGLSACGDFPTPQYPVSRQPDPIEPYSPPPPAPAQVQAPAPAPAAPGTDEAPRALPSAPVQQSTLPPPAAAKPKPGAYLDRSLDWGRPGRLLAVWRADDDVQVYPAATHHRKKAAPKDDAADKPETITVGKGDTLASISRTHGTTIDDLAKLNGLKSPYRLSAGQTLKLPGSSSAGSSSSGASDEAPAQAKGKGKAKSATAEKPETVTVGKGDTLASISRKSGMSIEDLAKLNGLEKPYRLKAGQTIQLKAAEAASDEPTPKAGSKSSKTAKATAKATDEDQSAPSGTSTITVRRHDTIQSLAKQEHMSVADIARLNHLKKPYRLKPGQTIKLPDQPGAAAASHAVAEPDEASAAPTVVTAGRRETLQSIADKHGVSVEALAKLNHIKKPYRIRRGQKIKLPSRPAEERPVQSTANATSYRVQSGDTLYSLARRFGTDAKTLAELNGMEAGERLTVGRRIRLPGGAEDRIAPKPNRSARPSVEPATPVPYSSLSANPPVTPAPGLAPPPTTLSPLPSSPPASTAPSSSGQAAPYRPTAPVVEAPVAGDAEVAAAGKGLFLWPVKGDILQRFGPLAGGQRSDGVDIADPAGTPVMASAAGEVVYAGNSVPSFGNMVLLRHEGGWVTVYAHLASLDVKMRQTVAQGQTIGAVGQTGGVSQPQLHFEVRYAPTAKDKPRTIDPMLVLPQ
jgi:murein DD-endopeptidase MepM/ murein hydrolase activator NlpD